MATLVWWFVPFKNTIALYQFSGVCSFGNLALYQFKNRCTSSCQAVSVSLEQFLNFFLFFELFEC